MAQFHTRIPVDLARAPHAEPLPHQLALKDHQSFILTALVYDSRAAAPSEVMAGTVTGHALRPDGATVELIGAKGAALEQVTDARGNAYLATPCTVTVPQNALTVPGRLLLSIMLSEGETVNTTVLQASLTVNRTNSDQIVDGGEVIITIDTLIAQVSDASETATQAAADAQSALAQASNIVSYAEQTGKTDAEKAQARTNIGAASEAEHFPATGKLVAGISTTASANGAVATGVGTTASGRASHAEGQLTTAEGQVAHAEGYGTTASGDYSHAEGFGTKASGDHQHVFGKYNVEDANDTYLEIAGNGTGDNARSNARTLDWNGNEALAGDLTVNKGGAEEMEVGSELSSLKSAFDKVTESTSTNILPTTRKDSAVNGVNVVLNDGQISMSGTGTANGGRLTSISDTLSLPAGTYTLSSTSFTEQIFVESGSAILAQIGGQTASATFTLNATTNVYLGINVSLGAVYNAVGYLMLEEGSTASEWAAPSAMTAIDSVARQQIVDASDDLHDEIDSALNYSEDITSSLVWTSGHCLANNGVWSENAYWSWADVKLTQGEALTATVYEYTSVFPMSVWSQDAQKLIKPCFAHASSQGTNTRTYVCGSEYERIRICSVTSAVASVVVKKYLMSEIVNTSNISAQNNCDECYDVLHGDIICIGDSLTQGSYTGSDLHESQSYPAFLQKMTGNNCTNAGRAGWTTNQWWTGDATKGFPNYNYTNYQTAIICLGTNGGLTDTIDTDCAGDDYTEYANTNTGCYCKIIEGMKAQNSGINIFLCTLWASGNNVGVTNIVIGKIADKYGLPVINLNIPELWSTYTIFHAVENNIHLGRIGYAKMAQLIRNGMNADVLNAPAKYNYIPA